MTEHHIGFGKPPQATRFQPGQSGNPRGRPRGSKNIALLLERICNERMTIMENGKPRRLSKKEIALRQWVSKAIKGDMRALEKLITEITAHEAAVSERQTRSALTLTAEQSTALQERLYIQRQTLADANA